ncbi:MAG: ribonuclease E inhibitor RraB [Gemmatimonadota bacterium]
MPMIFWVGLAFVVILFLVTRGKRLRPPSSTDDDVVAIRLLDEAGYDRTRPLEAEFLFFFPKEAAARAACARLEGIGFAGKTEISPEGSVWNCRARKIMQVELDSMRDLRQQLDSIARAEGGEYEGWEAGEVD